MEGSINLDRSDIENMVSRVREKGEQLGIDTKTLTLYIPSKAAELLEINKDESIHGVPCIVYRSDEREIAESVFCTMPATVYKGGEWRELTPLEWLASQGLEALTS